MWQKSRFPTLRERFANEIAQLHPLSQRLVTDGLATDGEKRFCSGIFCRISVLWRKKGPAARSNSDLWPIFGKLVEIHLQHPQIIEKFQQKLVYP
ncbi:hypothetical protein D0A34_18580 [Microcoleus vaginatus PCC 9802]|uniref:hypothetical protein n=1 Tax=Microcoleus vaginatus TaxID=119532 RepID=UPI00058768E6|nr:hypothetical protein D0A34_18580 [Microcoleus vaginatus PCC 9802]